MNAIEYDFTSEPEGRPEVDIVTGPPMATGSSAAAAICLLGGAAIFAALFIFGWGLPDPLVTWSAFALDSLTCWVVAIPLCRGRLVTIQSRTYEERGRSRVGFAVGPLKVKAQVPMSSRAWPGAAGVLAGVGVVGVALYRAAHMLYHDRPVAWLIVAGVAMIPIILGTILALVLPRGRASKKAAKKRDNSRVS